MKREAVPYTVHYRFDTFQVEEKCRSFDRAAERAKEVHRDGLLLSPTEVSGYTLIPAHRLVSIELIAKPKA